MSKRSDSRKEKNAGKQDLSGKKVDPNAAKGGND